MTYMVGPYNVTFAGAAYGDGKIYEMVVIEKFNGETYVQGSKKVLYFRNEGSFVIPKLLTEAEVIKFLKYPNFSRLEVTMVMQISKEREGQKCF